MFITSLKNQQEFELINKLGKKFHEKYFILVIAKNLPKVFLESKYNIFLGIKVSRKLNKKAVIRNKIKRRIRHLIRLIVNSAPFAYTTDTSKVGNQISSEPMQRTYVREHKRIPKFDLPNLEVSAVCSNDLELEKWNVKQGTSTHSLYLIDEHVSSPKFCKTNSSKQKSIYKKQRVDSITNRRVASRDVGESKSIDYIVNNSNLKIIKLAMIIIPRKGFEKADFSILSYELSKTILDSYISKKR